MLRSQSHNEWIAGFAWFVLVCAGLSGCAKTQTGGGSSETHFLSACSTDSCGEGLDCVCGVCTTPCERDSACRELSTESACLSPQASCDDAPASVCDVECTRDAECRELSAAHSCEGGRCRAPATAGGGECMFNGRTYENGATFPDADGCNSCFCEDGLVGCTLRACVDGDVPSCEAPSCLHAGVCYPDGTADIPDDCNSCYCEDGSLSCTDIACAIDAGPAPDGGASACSAGCEYQGICYPSGATSDDGCCNCDSEGLLCIEPGWCPGEILVGKRCDSGTEGECGMAYECQTRFFGERPVCSRDCNHGCPTDTECVAAVPGYLDDLVLSNVCLRPCSTAADCEDLGSECDMPPGLTQRYCF